MKRSFAAALLIGTTLTTQSPDSEAGPRDTASRIIFNCITNEDCRSLVDNTKSPEQLEREKKAEQARQQYLNPQSTQVLTPPPNLPRTSARDRIRDHEKLSYKLDLPKLSDRFHKPRVQEYQDKQNIPSFEDLRQDLLNGRRSLTLDILPEEAPKP